MAPVAIGLGLTLILLIGIPVTNLSVNPARSTGPALFVQGWAITQLWLFWVAPILAQQLPVFFIGRFSMKQKPAKRMREQLESIERNSSSFVNCFE